MAFGRVEYGSLWDYRIFLLFLSLPSHPSPACLVNVMFLKRFHFEFFLQLSQVGISPSPPHLGTFNYFGNCVLFWLFTKHIFAFLKPKLFKAFPHVPILSHYSLQPLFGFFLLFLHYLQRISFCTRAQESGTLRAGARAVFYFVSFIFGHFYFLIKNVIALRVTAAILKHLLTASYATVHPVSYWLCIFHLVKRNKKWAWLMCLLSVD